MKDTGFTIKHYLKIFAIGALLAGLFWAFRGPPETNSGQPEIRISAAEVAHQRARWEKVRGRPPTAVELKKAVDGYVRNEILYREALARQMDQGDPRVRLALVQKMQMLGAGQADAKGISEQDLEAFYALRKEQYRIPAKLSMKQVFFKECDGAEERALKLLGEFTEHDPTDPVLRESGDFTLLKTGFPGITATEMEKLFGTDFTAEVLALPGDSWAGPVRSGYGLHLVKVYDRISARTPGLAEVRDRVENDLLYETRQICQEQGYQEIASGYRIMITDEAEQMLGEETL